MCNFLHVVVLCSFLSLQILSYHTIIIVYFKNLRSWHIPCKVLKEALRVDKEQE